MSRGSLEKWSSLGSVVKEGRLLKRGEYIKNWRSRYMVLYSSGIMFGYKNNPADAPPAEAEEPLNEFDLRHGHVKATGKNPSQSGTSSTSTSGSSSTSSSSSNKAYTFTIGFLQVSHYIERHFSAESEALRNEWIEAITRVCDSSSSGGINTYANSSSVDPGLVSPLSHLSTAPSSTTTTSTVNNSTHTARGGSGGGVGQSNDHSSSNGRPTTNASYHYTTSHHNLRQRTTSPSAGDTKSSSAVVTYPTYDDFDKLKVLGQGSFGKVMLVREKRKNENGEQQLMAMKILKKSTLVAKNEVSHTLTEKHVLQSVSHSFLTRLIYAFQDKYRLFFVMEYAHGGELFYHLGKERRFEEPKARFYAAEIALGINHLHKHNILYRDIKLENIMIDHEGHIKITDFGLCKKGIDDAQTFCGTPEYLAPEVIALRRDYFHLSNNSANNNNGPDGGGDSDEDIVYGRAVDWWALGIVLYEMLFGRLPFFGSNQLDSKASQNELYRKICQAPLKFPQPRPIMGPNGQPRPGGGTPVSDSGKNILLRFLEKDPNKRLGAGRHGKRGPEGGMSDIKEHPFFHPWIDWEMLEAKQVPPPFVPQSDEEYFEKMFTDKPIELTPPEKDSHSKYMRGGGAAGADELFRDFNH